jgi:hypothetical protein
MKQLTQLAAIAALIFVASMSDASMPFFEEVDFRPLPYNPLQGVLNGINANPQAFTK